MIQYIPNTPQHRPPPPHPIHEAHAMDWMRRYQSPLCGGGKSPEKVCVN